MFSSNFFLCAIYCKFTFLNINIFKYFSFYLESQGKLEVGQHHEQAFQGA